MWCVFFMKVMNEIEVGCVRCLYPVGTFVVLDFVEGDFVVSCGCVGRVVFVDDWGCVHVDCGEGFCLVLRVGVDGFHKF